ncbi:hypothetical protein [Actinomadura geliboluensis]
MDDIIDRSSSGDRIGRRGAAGRGDPQADRAGGPRQQSEGDHRDVGP